MNDDHDCLWFLDMGLGDDFGHSGHPVSCYYFNYFLSPFNVYCFRPPFRKRLNTIGCVNFFYIESIMEKLLLRYNTLISEFLLHKNPIYCYINVFLRLLIL